MICSVSGGFDWECGLCVLLEAIGLRMSGKEEKMESFLYESLPDATSTYFVMQLPGAACEGSTQAGSGQIVFPAAAPAWSAS